MGKNYYSTLLITLLASYTAFSTAQPNASAIAPVFPPNNLLIPLNTSTIVPKTGLNTFKPAPSLLPTYKILGGLMLTGAALTFISPWLRKVRDKFLNACTEASNASLPNGWASPTQKTQDTVSDFKYRLIWAPPKETLITALNQCSWYVVKEIGTDLLKWAIKNNYSDLAIKLLEEETPYVEGILEMAMGLPNNEQLIKAILNAKKHGPPLKEYFNAFIRTLWKLDKKPEDFVAKKMATLLFSSNQQLAINLWKYLWSLTYPLCVQIYLTKAFSIETLKRLFTFAIANLGMPEESDLKPNPWYFAFKKTNYLTQGTLINLLIYELINKAKDSQEEVSIKNFISAELKKITENSKINLLADKTLYLKRPSDQKSITDLQTISPYFKTNILPKLFIFINFYQADCDEIIRRRSVIPYQMESPLSPYGFNECKKILKFGEKGALRYPFTGLIYFFKNLQESSQKKPYSDVTIHFRWSKWT